MSWKSLFELAELAADASDAQRQWWRETRAMIERADPAIYWYPGSGNDLTPLVLDAPNNPTGRRLFPNAAPRQQRPIILWMNDYAPDHGNFPAGYHGPVNRNHDVWQRLNANVALTGQPIELTVPPPDGCPGEPIAMRFFRATVTNDDICKRKRPVGGDEYTVIYSPVESESLLRSVFVPHRLAVEVVALIRQGGFSCQRPMFGGTPFEQYTDLPRVLSDSAASIGQVSAYIVDRDDWQLDGYRQSAARLNDWGADGARLFVRERSELATELDRKNEVQETEVMSTELWGERGLVTGIFLDLSAEAQQERWLSFLSAIDFAQGQPRRDWGQVDSVWCVVEPSFGKDGFGFPDAVACITFKDASKATVFFEAKTRTYAECVLPPAERHIKGYNSKLNGQLELKLRLALALEAPHAPNTLRDEAWVEQTPYRDAGFPRRVVDPSVMRLLVPRMQTGNANRYFFVAITSDTENPFCNERLRAFWPEVFIAGSPQNQWENERHRFGWIGWRSIADIAAAWRHSYFSTAFQLNAHYLAAQEDATATFDAPLPAGRPPQGVSVIYAPGLGDDAGTTSLHFSWLGASCRLRNYTDQPDPAHRFGKRPDRPVPRNTLDVLRHIVHEQRVPRAPGVNNN